MKKIIQEIAVILLVLINTTFLASGQAHSDFAGELERLFNRIRQDISTELKLAANDSIRNYISLYCVSDSVFTTSLRNIKYLGQISSPDLLIKLLTWNLVLPDGSGKYYCYIVSRKNLEDIDRPSVCRLETAYHERPPMPRKYSASEWYGALYYDLRPFVYAGRKYYALTGIDYGNSFVTRKIIEVLDISNPEEPLFGLECFSDGKIIRFRIVFEYSSTAIMSLRFETDSIIVFDHLSPFSPEFRGNFQFYGPDFTFDSYNFENGLWRLKSDIDIKNKEKREKQEGRNERNP